MVPLQLFYVTAFLITIIRSSDIRFQSYSGYTIKEIANITSSALKKYSNIDLDAQCLMLCREDICAAVAFHKLNKLCVIGKYGRIILISDPGGYTWIKRRMELKIEFDLIFHKNYYKDKSYFLTFFSLCFQLKFLITIFYRAIYY